MTRFTMSDTEGYSETDLAALNAAFDDLTSHAHLLGFADDGAHKSYLDNLAERLLAAYDEGKRGWDLRLV